MSECIQGLIHLDLFCATPKAKIITSMIGIRSLKSHPATQRFVRSFSAYSAKAPAECSGSTDGSFEHYKIPKGPGESNQRNYTYFLLGGARFIYVSAVRLALIKFVATMQPSADVLALASAEFNIDGVREGSTLTVKWRGKPVFIRHRFDAEIAKEEAVNVSTLKDPQADSVRVQNPKW